VTVARAEPRGCDVECIGFRGHYLVADGADSFNGHGDDIAGSKRRRLLAASSSPQFGEASAVAAGAGSEHVTGAHDGAAGGVGDQFGEWPSHVGQQVVADGLLVDGDGHFER
jgi:hypothetical protein